MLAVEYLKHYIQNSPFLPQKLAQFCGNQGMLVSTPIVKYMRKFKKL